MQKRTKKLLLIFAVASLVIFLIFISSKLELKQTEKNAQIQTSSQSSYDIAYVRFVIDGDTFVTNSGDKVRLIGIDTPEMNYKKGKPDCMAKESKEFLKNTILKKKVLLKKDKSDKDKYGRLLRYVYLPESGLFVNATLVEKGYAQVKYYPPNTSKYKELKSLEQIAIQKRLGVWSCNQ